jgi:hypothetical protein
MTKLLLTKAAIVVAALAFAAAPALAEDAAACDGLKIVSLTTSNASSAIDGELTTFTFTIAGVIEAASADGFKADAPVTVALKSGEDIRATEGVVALAAGERITLKTKATKWSPYADYGFDVVIGDGTAEGCTLSMDGSAVEQALRGQ